MSLLLAAILSIAAGPAGAGEVSPEFAARPEIPPPLLPLSAVPLLDVSASAGLEGRVAPLVLSAQTPSASAALTAAAAPAVPGAGSSARSVESFSESMSAAAPRRQASWWRDFVGKTCVAAGLGTIAGCASPTASETDFAPKATAEPEPAAAKTAPAAPPARRGEELLTYYHPEVFEDDFLRERVERLWAAPGPQAAALADASLHAAGLVEKYDRLRERFHEEQKPAGGGFSFFLRAGPEDAASHGLLADISKQDSEVLSAYNDALTAGSGAKMLAGLKTSAGKLSTDQKLTVVQMFGRQFNNDYDFNRNNLTARGAVSLDKLLATAAHDANLSANSRDFQYAGVCRDIASAQARMLKALGFKDTYAAAFMDDSGQYHVTVVTRDPGNPLKIYKLNYDERLTETGKDGPRSLLQGTRDTAINYQLYDAEGRQVENIASDLRKALTTVSGTDITMLDPLARPDDSMAVAGTDLAGGAVHLRAFAGRDSTRSIFGGVEADAAYLQESHTPGRISLALGTQNRDGNGANVSHDFIYAQLEQKAVSPKVRLGEDGSTSVWFEGTLNLASMVDRARQGVNDKSVGFQGDARVNADIKLDQVFRDGTIRLSHDVGAQFGPGLRDVRNLRTVTLAFNHAYARTKAQVKIDALSTESEPVYALASALLAVSQLSARGEISGGVAGEKIGVLVTLEGRVSRNMPVYEEGAKQRVRVTVYYRPLQAVSFSGAFYRSLEDRDAGGVVGLVLGED